MLDRIAENFFLLFLSAVLALGSLFSLWKFRNYVPVRAVCLNCEKEVFFDPDAAVTRYKNRFFFVYENKEYVAEEKDYFSAKHIRGKTYRIFICPDNPTELVTPSRIGFTLFAAVTGVVFFIAVLV